MNVVGVSSLYILPCETAFNGASGVFHNHLAWEFPKSVDKVNKTLPTEECGFVFGFPDKDSLLRPHVGGFTLCRKGFDPERETVFFYIAIGTISGACLRV